MRYSGTAVTSEIELMDQVDALYVCTWTSEHERLVAAACERVFAVFCEKSLAVDVAGARSMVAAVQRAGVTNQVGLVLRSTTGFALVRRGRIIAEGNAAESVTFEASGGIERTWATELAQTTELTRLGGPPPGNPDAEFIDAARARKPADPDFAVALRAHVVVDAAYRSASLAGTAVLLG